MPELPEVETVMRGLSPVLQGQVIDKVWCGKKGLRIPFPEGLGKRLQGKQVVNLSRRAKYILCHLEDENLLAIHLGMSGRVRILPPRSNAPEELHDHFKLTMVSGHEVVLNDARRFGMVFDVPSSQLISHKAFSHLGPEPLSDDFSATYLSEKLQNKVVPIKIAIMDQRVVVGVGNIYACEALYRAGISPTKKAGKVSKKKLEELVSQIKSVLEEAIEAGGSTLKDHRLPDGDFGYFQQKLLVYGQEGKNCQNHVCEHTVKRIVQGGRSTFYCPSCQS